MSVPDVKPEKLQLAEAVLRKNRFLHPLQDISPSAADL